MTAKRPERKNPVRSFVISGKMEKVALLVLIFFFATSARNLLNRPLWFDEALTVLNFALLDTPAKIYHSYIIPNNQIIHTIFLHWWIKYFSFDFLRLFPFICGILTLFFLWQMRRRNGNIATFIALSALAISFPFAIYGTALRGYMLAAMAVSGGVWMLSKYLDSGKAYFCAGWFVFSLLGVGTMPGTLAALAAAVLYAAGFCNWQIFKKRRIYNAAVVPVLALVIFYGPIFKNVLRCAKLGEGWPNGSAMLLALAMGIVFTFLPVIPAALAGSIRRHRISPEIFHCLIWLLPIPAAYIFKAAPFPRVFFPMFPIFALLIAGGIKNFLALMRKKKGRKYAEKMFLVICFATILWGALGPIESFRTKFSSLHPCPGGQEDFIDCHFVKKEFSPRETAAEFKKNFPDIPAVYATFGSDPWALMYAFMENGISTRILFDGPAGKIPGIPPVAIKHLTENKRILEERFQCHFQEVFSSVNHSVMVPVNE